MDPLARGNDSVLGDTVLQTAALEGNSSAVNYHQWLCALAVPYLGDHPLEIGSGLGDYATTWLEWGLPRITLSEIDDERRRRLEQKFAQDTRVDVENLILDQATPVARPAFTSVVSYNVLEHIPDDVSALAAARRLAGDKGNVITFAPAFPFAMSEFDRRIGHVRRYTLDSMCAAYTAAGLRPHVIKYVNAPGLLAWFVGMRLLRMTPGDGPILRIWDREVVPRARRWESGRKPPFGQSVFCVGTAG